MSGATDSPLAGLNDCGCCDGLGAHTPAGVFNRPGLNEIAYRSGTHAQFLDSLLARLTSADLPALQALRTRDADDFSIALCDAWATVCDVLTFYQERFANESFLRTAVERRSILELAELIGYQLRPGVSAEAMLAFTLEQAPGAPSEAQAIVTLDAGLPVQSVPGPDELPQTFETTRTVEGRVAWNAVAVQTTAPRLPGVGDTHMYLAGTATLLKSGDPILIVGAERRGDPTSARWDFRVLTNVEPDEKNQRTRVTWSNGLGASPQQVPTDDVKVYALRQRASLFGYNAPDPRTLRLDLATTDGVLTSGSGTTIAWLNQTLPATVIDLDAVYPKIVADSWMVLTASGQAALVYANNVSERTRTDFTISNKISRVTPDTMPSAATFGLSASAIFAHSEELTIAPTPLPLPLFGDELALDELVAGLVPGQAMAVRGARLRLRIAGTATGLTWQRDDGTTITVSPGDEFDVLTAPVLVVVPGGTELVLDEDGLQFFLGVMFYFFLIFYPSLRLRFTLLDRDGQIGTLDAQPAQFALIGAPDDAGVVDEIITIDDAVNAVSADRDRTTLRLASSLSTVYDRTTVTLNANVAPANHGASVSEVLGSGDAGASYQRFELRQLPLTYVTAATPSGATSTLDVRVNDVLWQEVPTLFGAGPGERIYTLRRSDEGVTTVQFGDGVNGARLPTGQDNVRVIYRKGIGLAGLVPAGKLSQLMARPLGLKDVTNPQPAEGGEDPEALDQARRNAPLTVLTLDRVVSLRDYADFSRAFAGVAKAHAGWLWDGDGRSVLVTVAGPNGEQISKSSKVYTDLLGALIDAGDPNARLRIEPYRAARFRIGARVLIDAAYEDELVLASIDVALRHAFSFDARDFGQPVMLSEVITVAQGVAGVIAVDVDHLYRGVTAARVPRLLAEMPETLVDGTVLSAELLTLDPAPLDKLERMP